jgi:hypothetical protein
MDGPQGSTQAALGQLLERQARRLEALVERVEQARARLPRQSDTVWRGPAARVYNSALDRLGADFAAAQSHLHDAAAGSRRAAAAVQAVTHG